jgi:spermidine synthase
MTLRVKKVLHHEKSQYQDVLIFESTDHGVVLVLDNVIQCTERDEFSYQEMITHLAMHSHPNPKKVLVIGGGDGGVLREVVKHECVEEAILCDIDEVPQMSAQDLVNIRLSCVQAVIRLSKQYLPGMAEGFKHPKSVVHVGDGFKFLNDYKNAFDVIITDSSDPEGPAESLFQKSYFQLLHDALRPGGVITTQGCMSLCIRKVRVRKGHSTCLVVPKQLLLRDVSAGILYQALLTPFLPLLPFMRALIFLLFSLCLSFGLDVNVHKGGQRLIYTSQPRTSGCTCP